MSADAALKQYFDDLFAQATGLLGWSPSEAEYADANDIIIALQAFSRHERDRMKFYGRVMGAKFADDDEPDPDDAPADIGAKIRQTFAGRIRKGGH